ncbi:probable ATP-dependent RNA helicase DDX31 [Bacillus rossius redtenbacheri]|uniref:probable ATP-dependent RNA helicase DDX31 n=1 Tax=Bacillus rossius redtenbacheri TaxID=93214 RepID=UPI002FDD4B13
MESDDISINIASLEPDITKKKYKGGGYKNKNKYEQSTPHRPTVVREPVGEDDYTSNEVTQQKKVRKRVAPGRDDNADVDGRKSTGPGLSKISSLFGNNPDIPHFPHRVVYPVDEPMFSSDNFADLKLHPYTVSNLKLNLGLEKMTTVQHKSIPVILSGKDVLIRSQTGSGKTLAYALPIVEFLHKIRPEIHRTNGIRALIVVPTRELALQTYELFIKLVKPFMRLVPGYLVGGEKRKSEKARLRKGINILVGTPGRLLDHVDKTKAVNLDRVAWLVLDEADRLLDMGYEQDVARLVEKLDSRQQAPAERAGEARQTLLLSATLTAAVQQLAGLALRDPTLVDAADEAPTGGRRPGDGGLAAESLLVVPSSLSQFYVLAPAKLRLVTLAAFIVWKCQLSDERKMLVFCATQDMVDFLTALLSSVLASPRNSAADDSLDDDEEEDCDVLVDVEFLKLHGNISQKERTEVFKTFRSADSGVLMCTDVAARGLDLPRVDWIVQYNAPCSAADYVHRVGRTARAGTAGSALLFLEPAEAAFVGRLEDRTVRLREQLMEHILEQLCSYVTPPTGRGRRRRSGPAVRLEEAATDLQRRFEATVLADSELHDLACRAYVSWVRFYASYPKEVRDVFSFKGLHLGHYAKSFGLLDPPKTIGGIGKRRGLQEQRHGREKRRRRPEGSERVVVVSTSRLPEVSEFGSGLDMPRNKKKKA